MAAMLRSPFLLSITYYLLSKIYIQQGSLEDSDALLGELIAEIQKENEEIGSTIHNKLVAQILRMRGREAEAEEFEGIAMSLEASPLAAVLASITAGTAMVSPVVATSAIASTTLSAATAVSDAATATSTVVTEAVTESRSPSTGGGHVR